MKPGTIEFSFLGIAFVALQFWWISMTIHNDQKQKVIATKPDPLVQDKKRLENLLKK